MKKNTIKNLTQNIGWQRGYSLVGLIVAVALGAAVCLGAAYVMTRSQFTANFASMQNELDRLHYLNLQKARNIAFIRQQLGLPDNAPLQNCLAQQKSTACNHLAQTKSVPQDSAEGQGLEKNLKSDITLGIECANSACQQVKVTVDSTYTTPPQPLNQSNAMGTMNYTPRHTVVYYPAFVIVPPSGIDYSCAFNQIMTGVDAGNLTAICTPVSGNLTGNNPLSNFGGASPTPSTQPPSNTTCPPGQFVVQAGIFAGQTICKAAAAPPVPVPPPAPPTTTTTTVPSKSGACNPATDPTCLRVTVRECFLAGTPVLMANGSQKAIEKIRVGDIVTTYDEVTGQQVESPVTETLHHEAKLQSLYHFVMEDGANFTSNDVHLIYVPTLLGYFSAASIYNLWLQDPSLSLLGRDGQKTRIKQIYHYSDVVPTYNLHVQGISQTSLHDLGRGHNYYVDGVLVHNSKCIEHTETGGCTAFAGGLQSLHGAVVVWDGACYPSALVFKSTFDLGFNGDMARGIMETHAPGSSECQTLPNCGGSCGTPNGRGYCVYRRNVDRWFSGNKAEPVFKPGTYCAVSEGECVCPSGPGPWHWP